MAIIFSYNYTVDQLRSVAVKNYKDIEDRIAEGTKNRTIASTNMNATSSRAHTIVAITFVQKTKNEFGQNMSKTSVINLVDLAGRYVAIQLTSPFYQPSQRLKCFSACNVENLQLGGSGNEANIMHCHIIHEMSMGWMVFPT